jgi:hypothetical protein
MWPINSPLILITRIVDGKKKAEHFDREGLVFLFSIPHLAGETFSAVGCGKEEAGFARQKNPERGELQHESANEGCRWYLDHRPVVRGRRRLIPQDGGCFR